MLSREHVDSAVKDPERRRLWRALCDSGLTGKKLEVFEVTDAGDIAFQLCSSIGLVYESRYGWWVASWIRDAKASEPMQKRLRGEHTMDPLHPDQLQIVRALEGQPSGSRVLLHRHEDWMPRPLRSRALGGDQGHARQRAEDELKEKWARELMNEMVRVHAPALKELEVCVDPSRLPLALAGKTRASTLRRYVKSWRDWLNWLQGSRGGLEHAAPGAFCEYLFHRFDEPCGSTVPTFIVKAVAWFERTAMLPAVERVADSQVVYGVRDHVVEVLSRKAPPMRRAPRYPAVLFEAFENVVLDERRCVGFRIIACVKLIKLWGTLRYDDIQKIVPKELKYTWGRLSTVLRITKTSGPGKRIQELPVVITERAYVRSSDWIKVGFDLLRRAAPFDRDYLLPKMTGDMNFFVQRMATYNDICSYSATLRRLVELKRGAGPLLPEVLSSFWTEHSERSTIPTGLAIVGCAKSERDMLGRWKPEGSDTYIRSYAGVVRRLQDRFARVLRLEDRSSLLDENDIVEGAQAWLQERSQQPESWEIVERDLARLGEGILMGPQFETQKDEEEDLGDEEVNLLEDPGPGAEDQGLQRARYVVVNVSKNCKRLHKAAGGCWMGRSRVFKSSVEFETKPEESEFTHVCRVCWPPRKDQPEEDPGPSSEDSSSSSSSSSSVEGSEV